MSSDVSKTKLIFFLNIYWWFKFYGQSERRSIEFFCFLCVYFYVLPVFLSKSVHVSNYNWTPNFFKIRVHRFDRVVQSFFSKFQNTLKKNICERVQQSPGLLQSCIFSLEYGAPLCKTNKNFTQEYTNTIFIIFTFKMPNYIFLPGTTHGGECLGGTSTANVSLV